MGKHDVDVEVMKIKDAFERVKMDVMALRASVERLEVKNQTQRDEIVILTTEYKALMAKQTKFESKAKIENVLDKLKVLDTSQKAQDKEIASLKKELTKKPVVKEVKVKKVNDDLTKIEGIGPVIQRHLRREGIRTYADLARAKVTVIRKILEDNKLKALHNPKTWATQARMARDEKWEELLDWQKELDGGL